jgi:hypothetical protein
LRDDLVQLYYRDLISEDVFEREQEKLKKERHAAEHLRTTASAQVEDVEEALELALRYVDQPYSGYVTADSLNRRLLPRHLRADRGRRGRRD